MKAPPDLAKVESLLAYFGARAIPYRFVALTQHPCLLTESHRKHELLNISAYYLHTAVRATPPPNLFVLDYERLLADAEGAAQELADWLPALRELDLRKGLDLKSGGDRELSVAEYVESASCARAVQRDSALRFTADVEAAAARAAARRRRRRGGGWARERRFFAAAAAAAARRARVDPVAADAALGARRARRAARRGEPAAVGLAARRGPPRRDAARRAAAAARAAAGRVRPHLRRPRLGGDARSDALGA